VRQGATGNGTGENWSDAIPELADALKAAKELNNATPGTITEIWVAKGTYKPLYRASDLVDVSDDPLERRNNAFVLVSDVKLYGGFDPDNGIDDLSHTRVLPGANNANPFDATILSGDVDNDGILNNGNVYHVVVSSGNVGTALLDGFVITEGHAGDTGGSISVNSYSISKNFGAGIYHTASSPKISNVSIYANKIVSTGTTPAYGGGLYNAGLSFPELTNVCITGNEISALSGATYGAGIYFATNNDVSNYPKLNNVVISHNTATSSAGVAYGIGMYITASSPVFTNVAIRDNIGSAGTNAFGGGLFQNGASMSQFINVLITNNSIVGGNSSQGGGLYTTTSLTGYPTLINATISSNTASTSPEWHAAAYSHIRNSVVYGNGNVPVTVNTVIENSLIQGRNVDTDGNIPANTPELSLDAIFNDPANGDYTLKSGSNPLIDAGNDDVFPNLDPATKDLAGNPRVYGSSIDIGAYEFNIFNIVNVTNPEVTSVDYGTVWADIVLPAEAEVELNNGTVVNVPLSAYTDWTLTSSPESTEGGYDGSTAGDYVYSAPLITEGFTNTDNLVATVTVRVNKGTLDVRMEDIELAFDETVHSLAVNFVEEQPAGVSVDYTISANGDSAVPGNSATEVGVYTITANIDGGNNYENHTLTAILTIAPFSWDNVMLNDDIYTYDGTAKSLSISGALPSSAAVTYIYSIGGNVIPADQVINVGIYNVQADVDGGTDYGNHTLNAILTIDKASFTNDDIAFQDATYDYDGMTKILSVNFVNGQPVGVSVDYTISKNAGTAVSGNSATDVGIYTVVATVNGGNNYNDWMLTATLNIQLTQRTITFDVLPEKAYGDEDFLLEAEASTGEPVLFSSSNSSVATVEGDVVRIIGVGETTISATVVENPNYGNKPVVEQTLKVKKAVQQIEFTAPEKVSRDIGRIPLSVSSSSGLPVTLIVEDPAKAILDGTELYVHNSLGAIRITATQSGDGNFEEAIPVKVVIRVVEESLEAFVRLHPAVSPNGDGINDFLIIDGIRDYPDNKLVIHDREGRIVFDVTGYDNVQNVFTGDNVKDGTYFYNLEITVNGQRKQAKGFFNVKRN